MDINSEPHAVALAGPALQAGPATPQAESPPLKPGRAVEFLKKLRPAGPWVLTAVDPKRKAPTDTKTFKAGQEENLMNFLWQHHEGRWNVYYTLNSLIGP